jgi:hypothetical protein
VLRRVTDGCADDHEKAVRIFFHVRDSIRFALMGSGMDFTASKTGRIGYGDCGSKTNYQVALLRAAGIPARMRGIMCAIAPLEGVIPDIMYALCARFYKEDLHFWPECYLAGRWVACEGLWDRPLYEAALQNGLINRERMPTIDWDGETGLVLLGAWQTEDLGHRPAWDEWYVEFKRKMATPGIVDKLMEWSLAPLCRRKTDQLRRGR